MSDGDEFYYLYDKLLEYFSETRKKDQQINVCCREISRLQENLEEGVETDDAPEEKELEDYVKNNFDVEIVEDIEANPDLFGCESLEFLQLLEETSLFIQQNYKNPLTIKKRLKENFPNRPYFLKRLQERLQRHIIGYDLTYEQRQMHELFDTLYNENSKLEEAVELIHDERITAGDLKRSENAPKIFQALMTKLLI